MNPYRHKHAKCYNDVALVESIVSQRLKGISMDGCWFINDTSGIRVLQR